MKATNESNSKIDSRKFGFKMVAEVYCAVHLEATSANIEQMQFNVRNAL